MNGAGCKGAGAPAALAAFTGENVPAAQVIHVAARGMGAEICCLERDSRMHWQPVTSLAAIPGHVGRNGVSGHKKEGDGCTPLGLYRLGTAFGCSARPETRMAFRAVTPHSFWVDDPGSRYYNTWVEGASYADWKSAERLADYPVEYAYAVVIEYNTADRRPGKGSAVFLHCGDRPTAGCVAVPERALLRILKWLEPEKTPAILISDKRLSY